MCMFGQQETTSSSTIIQPIQSLWLLNLELLLVLLLPLHQSIIFLSLLIIFPVVSIFFNILFSGLTNGILWAIGNDATFRAIDANDVTTLLWSSEINSARDAMPAGPGHFEFPTVANAKAYVPSGNAQLEVYGLLAPKETSVAFTIQPGNSIFTNQRVSLFQVSITDDAGNVIPSAWSVTVSCFANAGFFPPLGGVITVAAINGVATFDQVVFPSAGSYQIVATVPGLKSAMSTPVIVANPPPMPSTTVVTAGNLKIGVSVFMMLFAMSLAW